jgi:chloride channel protein, CIC family
LSFAIGSQSAVSRSIRFQYDTKVFTPANPWAPSSFLPPWSAAVAVTFLVTKFAPEAKGHGVPEVMDAIYYGGRRDSARGGGS